MSLLGPRSTKHLRRTSPHAAEHPAEAAWRAHGSPTGRPPRPNIRLSTRGPLSCPSAKPSIRQSGTVDTVRTQARSLTQAIKTEAAKTEATRPTARQAAGRSRSRGLSLERGRPQPPGTRPAMPRMQPSAGSRRAAYRRGVPAGGPDERSPVTGSAHDAAPSLDDGQRGPCGRRAAGAAPSCAASVGAGHGARCAIRVPVISFVLRLLLFRSRNPIKGATPPPGDGAAKPGARTIQ